MLHVIRFALQCVIVLLLLGVVIGIAGGETSVAETIGLAAFGIALVYASVLLRRVGHRGGAPQGAASIRSPLSRGKS